MLCLFSTSCLAFELPFLLSLPPHLKEIYSVVFFLTLSHISFTVEVNRTGIVHRILPKLTSPPPHPAHIPYQLLLGL